MTPILLLAAGRSTRMAPRDKLAEPVRGMPLLRHVATMALGCGEPVFVALPLENAARAALIDGLPLTILRLPGSAEGLGGTLRDGVAALPDCGRFMVLPTDLPDLTTEDLETVLAAPQTAPAARIWRAATQHGQPGHPILFDASLRSEFGDLAVEEGARNIVARHRAELWLVPLPGDRALRDLDTPEDWAEWRAAKRP